MAISQKRRDKRRRKHSGWGDLRWLKHELVVEDKPSTPLHNYTIPLTLTITVLGEALRNIQHKLVTMYTPTFEMSLSALPSASVNASISLVAHHSLYRVNCVNMLEDNPDQIVPPFVAKFKFCDAEENETCMDCQVLHVRTYDRPSPSTLFRFIQVNI